MSRKSYEVDSQLGEAKRRIDRLVSSVSALESDVRQQNARVQTLEDILIKAGILVEIKDPPAAVSDITIGRSVRYTGPFRFFGPPTMLENKKYAVVVPVKKNSDIKTNKGDK